MGWKLLQPILDVGGTKLGFGAYAGMSPSTYQSGQLKKGNPYQAHRQSNRQYGILCGELLQRGSECQSYGQDQTTHSKRPEKPDRYFTSAPTQGNIAVLSERANAREARSANSTHARAAREREQKATRDRLRPTATNPAGTGLDKEGTEVKA